MAWEIRTQDPESGLYQWVNSSDPSQTVWGGLDGTYWTQDGTVRNNINALQPTSAGWTANPSVDVPEVSYTPPSWTNNSVTLLYNPAIGPKTRIEALEALYGPYINGDTARMNEIIAASPQAFSGFGITPQNAGSLVNSEIYQPRQNDNDPLGFLNNLAFLPHAMGAANLFSGGNLFGGAETSGGGMDWWGTDYMGDFGYPAANVDTLMPPAVPESVDTLKSWGLVETSPGVWAQPAMPSLQMGPSDWLKLGSQALSGLGGSTPNVNTMGGLGNLASMFGSTGGLLGAGLGGLAGMLNGTKKIDDAVTTESGYNSTLSPAAEAEMLKTIRGDYLNPDSNPWLKSTFDRAAGEIQSKLSPAFGHMEAFGQNSGFQNAFGRSLADLGTSLYGGNYNNERTRQYGAASAAPNYTKKSTTPVYSNPLGGMFSGALAGGLLGGKLFGG